MYWLALVPMVTQTSFQMLLDPSSKFWCCENLKPHILSEPRQKLGDNIQKMPAFQAK